MAKSVDGNVDSMTALGQWMKSNPEAFNVGIGFLKSMGDKKRNEATAMGELAKTQYGHYLGQGPGDMSRAQGPSAMDRFTAGVLSGQSQRRKDEFNRAIMDALQADRGKTPKARPTESLAQAQTNQNPYNPVTITPEAQGPSAEQQMKAALTGEKVVAPMRPQGDTIPDIFKQDVGISPMEDMIQKERAKRRSEKEVDEVRRTPASFNPYSKF